MSQTVVTALLDLGRGEVGRDFSYYISSLERVAAIEAPMVLFVEENLVERTLALRRDLPTEVRTLSARRLEQCAEFESIEAIRTSSEWLASSEWLPTSPQARLPHYAPLVLAKPSLLLEVAQTDPFSTERFLWLDAGIFSNRKYRFLGRWVSRGWTPAERLLVFSYPVRVDEEQDDVNGMPAAAFCSYCEVPVRFWVRGGLFAGGREDLEWFSAEYDELLRRTLANQHLGTEENLFTILAHRTPERFDRQRLWLHRFSSAVGKRALCRLANGVLRRA